MVAEAAFGKAVREYFSKNAQKLYREYSVNGTSVGGSTENGIPVVTIRTERKLSQNEKKEILADITNTFFHFKTVGKIRPLSHRKK